MADVDREPALIRLNEESAAPKYMQIAEQVRDDIDKHDGPGDGHHCFLAQRRFVETYSSMDGWNGSRTHRGTF